MAALYGDIVWNAPVYAVVMVLVALVEFGAYAMAPGGHGTPRGWP